MAYELKLKTHNNHIVWYWSNNKWSKKCVILAPWFPHYFDKYHPFVNSIINQWIDLFIIRYAWSWENKWIFTIQNCIQSIQDCISLIQEGQGISLFNNQKIFFNYESIYLIWFSFGALPVLFTKNDNNILHKILICPFLHHSFHIWWSWENIMETFEFVKKWYWNLYNYSVDNIIHEIQNLTYNISDKQSEYTLIIGEHDNAIPDWEINRLKENYKVKDIIYSPSWHSIVIKEDIFTMLFNNNGKTILS